MLAQGRDRQAFGLGLGDAARHLHDVGGDVILAIVAARADLAGEARPGRRRLLHAVEHRADLGVRLLAGHFEQRLAAQAVSLGEQREQDPIFAAGAQLAAGVGQVASGLLAGHLAHERLDKGRVGAGVEAVGGVVELEHLVGHLAGVGERLLGRGHLLLACDVGQACKLGPVDVARSHAHQHGVGDLSGPLDAQLARPLSGELVVGLACVAFGLKHALERHCAAVARLDHQIGANDWGAVRHVGAPKQH